MGVSWVVYDDFFGCCDIFVKEFIIYFFVNINFVGVGVMLVGVIVLVGSMVSYCGIDIGIFINDDRVFIF